MGMSRCYSLMKCLLILFNIVFLMIGLAACGLSVWALWEGGADAGVGGAGAGDAAAARAGLCAAAAWGGALALGAVAALWGAARDAPSLLAAAFALLALCGAYLCVWALWEGGADAGVGGAGAGDAAAARAGLCAAAAWGGALALGAVAALWGAARDAPSLLAAAFALLALCGAYLCVWALWEGGADAGVGGAGAGDAAAARAGLCAAAAWGGALALGAVAALWGAARDAPSLLAAAFALLALCGAYLCVWALWEGGADAGVGGAGAGDAAAARAGLCAAAAWGGALALGAVAALWGAARDAPSLLAAAFALLALCGAYLCVWALWEGGADAGVGGAGAGDAAAARAGLCAAAAWGGALALGAVAALWGAARDAPSLLAAAFALLALCGAYLCVWALWEGGADAGVGGAGAGDAAAARAGLCAAAAWGGALALGAVAALWGAARDAPSLLAAAFALLALCGAYLCVWALWEGGADAGVGGAGAGDAAAARAGLCAAAAWGGALALGAVAALWGAARDAPSLLAAAFALLALCGAYLCVWALWEGGADAGVGGAGAGDAAAARAGLCAAAAWGGALALGAVAALWGAARDAPSLLAAAFALLALCGAYLCVWALWEGGADAGVGGAGAGDAAAARAGLCAAAAWGGALALGAVAALWGVARDAPSLLAAAFALLALCGAYLCVWALWEGGADAGVGGAGTGDAAAARAGLCAAAACGGALALGAVAALWGAARDAPSLLAAAFALLALCGVAEAAAACWGAAHLPQLRRALSQRLHYAVRHEYGALGVTTQFLDTIQTELKCCGAEGARDWQGSVWARAEAGAAEPAPQPAALDLSVTAPTSYYYVPPSCCATADDPAGEECSAARRVPAASGSAAGLHQAACAPRVLHALETGARLPLAIGAGLLALHGVTLLLALALCLRARPAPRYKA